MATKVGDTLFRFEANHREYPRGTDGTPMGGTIFRAHFRPWLVVGFEKRSLLVSPSPDGSHPTTVSPGCFKTEAEVDDACWLNENAHRVRALVDRCRDAAKLRAIAGLFDGIPGQGG